MKTSGEQGNAIVEFIAFAMLLLVPLAGFSATVACSWVNKERAVAAATQLARAYSLGQDRFDSAEKAYLAIYPTIQISTDASHCCVLVKVLLAGEKATSKMVL